MAPKIELAQVDAAGAHPPPALKPPVDPATLVHRQLLGGEFWRKIPAYSDIGAAEFLDHKWQAKHSITNIPKLLATVSGLVSDAFVADAQRGFERAPMSVRVSPYLLSLIDWAHPYEDPLRTQFIPLGSRLLPDHPRLDLDSLHERADMPVPGLTHRYVDKALFLALDTCPVYCRFCTRSYAVGIDTEEVEKFQLKVNAERWEQTFGYIRSRPELEDIVISGGDAYQLRAEQITQIGETLLSIDHVRRMRYATKGLAVMPQKILTDDAWVDALTGVVEHGRKLHKEVVIHTHFNHPREITEITKAAMDKLVERGITVRNQTVLQRGVNDSADTMALLVRRLSYVNVHPYYVYMHDLVKGVEDLRTTLATGLHDREGDPRRHGGVQHADRGRRRAGRRRQARRPLVRALRPHDRHLGLHGAGGPPGRGLLLLRPHRPPAAGRPGALGQSGRARPDDRRSARGGHRQASPLSAMIAGAGPS